MSSQAARRGSREHRASAAELLFSANGPARDVSIVDLATKTVLKKVKAGNRPRGVVTVAQE